MHKHKIKELKDTFEQEAKEVRGIECWSARTLQKLLGYVEWRKFENAIHKAEEACKNSGERVLAHFVEVDKTSPMPQGGQRIIKDYLLSRYACYLIAQNGDSRKEEIAFAQSYFALQTRKSELIEERIKITERVTALKELRESKETLQETILQRGIDEKGFREIADAGDKELFNMSNEKLREKMNIPKDRNIDDFLPKITLAAKNFSNLITEANIHQKNLQNKKDISEEHQHANRSIRNTLKENDIRPENLPPEEDIKESQKKLKE
ncbi:MAG: DNA damage-inducible protein D [Bacteroidota bacterium]